MLQLKVLLKSTNNLEGLSKGDLVLLKPALNSPNPYPSTTHPLSVKVVKEVLTEMGAEVVIGDQSGLKDAFHDSSGVIHGKIQDNYIKSDILLITYSLYILVSLISFFIYLKSVNSIYMVTILLGGACFALIIFRTMKLKYG